MIEPGPGGGATATSAPDAAYRACTATSAAARDRPAWLLVLPFPRGPVLVVVVAGEADCSTAGQLRDQLVAALSHRPTALVVDLADLEFCDLHGLDALHEAVEVAEQRGVSVSYRGLSPQLAWLRRAFPRRPAVRVAEPWPPAVPATTRRGRSSARR